jgi:hypothetical protein
MMRLARNWTPLEAETTSLSLQALAADNFVPAPSLQGLERGSRAHREAVRELQRERREADREAQREHQEARERAALAMVGPGDPADPVRERDIARLSDNSSLLIARVHGLGYQSGVVFVRLGATENTIDYVNAVVPTAFISGPKEQTVVAVVPPGRWRLSAFHGPAGYVTSLCMGAPSFDLGAGDVVFAGSFAFGEHGSRLDMHLDHARTALAAAPTLSARVRAAEYRNGATFSCGAASGFYSYEIAGVPYADDYRFGSRANTEDVVSETSADATADASTTEASATSDEAQAQPLETNAHQPITLGY